MAELARRWRECCAALGATPPDGAFDGLMARYGEPHRAYHTIRHLEECFAWYDRVRAGMCEPARIALALFYHDAVYDTHARDNEAKSAELARAVADVTDLVLATRHDAAPVEHDAMLLVDIDLSILGAAEARFDEYERQIRFEYSWVNAEDFRRGRVAVLESFLARETIYATAPFRARLESAARANLARSLAALAHV